MPASGYRASAYVPKADIQSAQTPVIWLPQKEASSLRGIEALDFITAPKVHALLTCGHRLLG